MTVVVAAVVGDHVYLAGDSYCGDDDIAELCSDPKVLRLSNTVGMGLCGDVRTEILLVKAMKSILGKKAKVTEGWLKTGFVLSLHSALKDSGVLKDNKGIHTLADSEYVVAHAGRLYYLDEGLALWSPRQPYAAIGVGRGIAMGALAFAHASGDLEEDPEATLLRVLEVTAQHSHFVRPPYTSLKI